MTPNDAITIVFAGTAGLALGLIFFGGLWWTVRKAVASRQPALWFLGSLLARMAIVLAGFYLRRRRRLEAPAGVPRRLHRGPPARDVVDSADPGGHPCTLVPTRVIFWQHGFVKLSATIVFTWALMAIMVVGAKLVTRKLSVDLDRARWQNVLEIIVIGIEKQIADVGLQDPKKYLGFLGTLFLFVACAALGTVVPGFEPPTASLSTTAALALCVFVAVPMFGVMDQGAWGYLKTYTQPTVIMLPFNLISEASRTLALAVRLFGNMMSGAMIVGILLTITPFLFPIVMTALGLLTGMVQAYIFAILAAVYIAAATRSRKPAVAATP